MLVHSKGREVVPGHPRHSVILFCHYNQPPPLRYLSAASAVTVLRTIDPQRTIPHSIE